MFLCNRISSKLYIRAFKEKSIVMKLITRLAGVKPGCWSEYKRSEQIATNIDKCRLLPGWQPPFITHSQSGPALTCGHQPPTLLLNLSVNQPWNHHAFSIWTHRIFCSVWFWLQIKANRRVITTINWAATPPTLNQLARHGHQRLGLLQYAL